MIILLILLLHHLGNVHANRAEKTELTALPVETTFEVNSNPETANGFRWPTSTRF